MTRLHVSCRFAPYAERPGLLARHGLPVAEPDAVWYESFGPDCWLLKGRGAQVQFGHNTKRVGDVIVVAGIDRWWHADMQLESDDAALLARCKPGAPVSVGFDPLRADEDYDLRLRRHTIARLSHVAILKPGEIPAYADAKIMAVSAAKVKARQAALSDAQAYEQLWRRVDGGGEEFMDAYNALGGANRPHNWYLPAHPYQRAA